MQFTSPVCSASVDRHSPVSMSQIFIVPSHEPETIRFPSGLTAMLYTQFLCPVSFLSSTAMGVVSSDFCSTLLLCGGSDCLAGGGVFGRFADGDFPSREVR